MNVLIFEDLAAKGWSHTREHTARLIREGKFPKPFKMHDGGRRNYWLEIVIDEFLTARARPEKPPSSRHKGKTWDVVP